MLELILAVATSLTASEEWRSLATPIACASGPDVALPMPLVNASHLELPHVEGRPALGSRGGILPVPSFLQMVEEDARLRGARLELQRQGGGALARGDAAAWAGVDALTRSLDAAERALAIDLGVVLRPTQSKDDETALAFERRVRSGDFVFLGTRESRAYVAGFDVEVAAQSGQSEPIVGRVHSGRGVHLFAARVQGGERVFVWGLVDVARVVSVEEFDPETSDLGVLEQPRVVFAQVAFSGLVPLDAPLQVLVSGANEGDFFLEVRARTTRDADVDANAGEAGYAVVDLAASAFELPALAARDPGALLSSQSAAGAIEPGVAPWPPSAVAALVEGTRGAGNKSARPSLYWNDRCLFVPRADSAALSAARALARGAEAARTAGGVLELSFGGLRASVPTSAVAPARVVAGAERPLLTEYRLEVAPQIWMPAPIVEVAFDGVCLDVIAGGSGAEAGLWVASSGPIAVRERSAAQIGRLQLAARTFEAGRARLDASAATKLEMSGQTSAAATLRWVPR